MKITKKNVGKASDQDLKKRQDELYQEALDNFLGEQDWDMYDYLSNEETEEYERISFHLGEGDYNPDE